MINKNRVNFMDKKTYQIMKENEDYHWWFVARRSIIQKILTTFLPNKSGDILEVGCGSGGNLSCLSQFGTIFAMECDDDALAFAKLYCPQLRTPLS